jgi:catechol 2,3-dioxygenase-like lactoylglutathione lyase family enzyme
MTIDLDHTIIPSRNRVAAARQVAELLDVPWAPTALGPFAAVYVNDRLTLDFIDTDEAFPIHHFCFRVDDATFDAILARLRAAGIAWRSTVRGPVDRGVDTSFGGRGLYWNEPDGHQWEMLTVSYARRSGADTNPPPGSG